MPTTKSPLAFVLACSISAALPAQERPPCPAAGRVVDQSGAVLPGALITRAEAPPVVTGADGAFCLADLGAGEHTITVTLPGFAPAAATIRVPTLDSPVSVVLTPEIKADVVVTATRTSRHLDDVPVRTEVVSRDLLNRSGARTLADAVEYTTGVRVENNCQNCNFSQIRLLGLDGPYTQILVDGQPVVSSLAQVYGIEQIPARMIERIEVVKGGGSALYGPGSVGGVVNIIPREPPRKGALLELRSDTFGPGANVSASGSGDWVSTDRRTYVSAFGQVDRVRPYDADDDGFTEVSRRDLQAAGVRVNRYQLEGRAKATFDVTFFQEHRRGGDSLHLPPHEALIAEQIDSRRAAVSGTWFHSVSRRFDYRLTLSSADTTRDSYYGVGRDPNAYGDTENRVTVVDSQLNHYAGRHTVSWGAQLSSERLDDRQPAYNRRTDVSYRNAGLYVQDDWSFAPRWQLLYGARADTHTVLGSPVVSPRVALMHSPVPALDIRVSYAKGFRAPQVFDEDLHLSSVAGSMRLIEVDPGLREEHSANYMAGFEWKPELGRGQALLEANGFYTKLDDLFNVQEADRPETPVAEFRKVNFGGAEPDFGSRDFFRTPRRYGNGMLTWKVPRLVDLFAAARYTGPMKAPHYAGYIPAHRLETTPAFVVVDLALSRTFAAGNGPRITLGISARNVTDAYQRDLDRGPLRDAAYVYGPRFPRTVGATIRVEY